jgi:tetratricopeptide (TPR) repeat protein
METKDIISISISSLAFLLSAAATMISVVRSKYEKQRAIKKEITDTLSKIVSTALENAKLFRESAEKDPAYYQAVSSILNQQNAFLLQQATYLTDEVPDLVTAVEYNTIAAATANAGDLISAEKYYKKAIEVSPNNYYRSLAIRSYAAYLFPQRRFEEARENFKKAISLLTGGDNLVRYTNGFTYQMWAWNESNNAASSKRAEELFESAINEFSGIDNETVRRDALNGLQAAKGSPSAPNPMLQPTAPNVVAAELKR